MKTRPHLLLYTFRMALTVATICQFCSSNALASTVQLDDAVRRATRSGIAPMLPGARTALAEAALTYWQNFNARIPRNSPATLDWMRAELSNSDQSRSDRALNSAEFALQQLSNTATTCIANFGNLKNSVGKGSFIELYSWTKALWCYTQKGDLQIYLRRANLSNGQDDGDFRMEHFYIFQQTVTGYIANDLLSEAQANP